MKFGDMIFVYFILSIAYISYFPAYQLNLSTKRGIIFMYFSRMYGVIFGKRRNTGTGF